MHTLALKTLKRKKNPDGIGCHREGELLGWEIGRERDRSLSRFLRFEPSNAM